MNQEQVDRLRFSAPVAWGTEEDVQVLRKSGPPGPPPRPGLEWKEETRRWIRPDGSEYDGEDAEIGVSEKGIARDIHIASQVVQNEPPREQGSPGDNWLKKFAWAKWGDQQATVVDGETFDAIDSPVMLRGVSNAQYVESNLDGGFYGNGAYGNGQYYASGRYIAEAFAYGNMNYGGWVHAAKLSPDARIATWEDRVKAMQMEEDEQMDSPLDEDVMNRAQFNEDLGRLMAFRGYDALVTPEGYMVVLNRNKLVVDERTLPGGEFTGGPNDEREDLQRRSDEVNKQLIALYKSEDDEFDATAERDLQQEYGRLQNRLAEEGLGDTMKDAMSKAYGIQWHGA